MFSSTASSFMILGGFNQVTGINKKGQNEEKKLAERFIYCKQLIVLNNQNTYEGIYPNSFTNVSFLN